MSDPGSGVVFVGELTVDAIVTDPGAEPGQWAFERTAEPPQRWQARLATAVAKGHEVQFVPGGSIANVAAAYASTAAPRWAGWAFVAVSTPRTAPASWPLWWPGYDVAALDLTARGIRVYGRDPARTQPDLPGCIATLGPDHSVTHLIAWQETEAPPTLVPGELLVIRSDHLELLDAGYLGSFSQLAVLLADDDQRAKAALDAAAGRSATWIFGRLDQIAPLAGPALAPGLTLVGTAGHRPVLVYPAGGGPVELAVAKAQVTGSDLGAGDAYMGGFLRRARDGDGDVIAAHESGCEQAAVVLTAIGARAPVSPDLNRLLPAWVDRRSPSASEGTLIGTVHRSPGLAVLTGGQTGVDELAAAATASAAIATHVIVPWGGRREAEGGPDPSGAATSTVRVHELASPSYRYRTWACVYASDAVILLDYVGSEGSAETRRAARWLNRPLIEVGDAGVSDADLDGWLADVAPEAVLIAGNRASLLSSAGRLDDASARIDWVVSRLVCCVKDRAAPDPAADDGPLAGSARLTCPEWLWASPPVRAAAARAGFDGEPVFLPPRDVAAALESGLADAGITWPSLLRPDSIGSFTVRAIGVGACYYGFLGTGPVLHRPASIGVQYREAYARLPAGTRIADDGLVVPITGSAESWVSAGLVQTAFDTYYTGKTMDRFGLDGFWPVAWESVSLLTRRGCPGTAARPVAALPAQVRDDIVGHLLLL